MHFGLDITKLPHYLFKSINISKSLMKSYLKSGIIKENFLIT